MSKYYRSQRIKNLYLPNSDKPFKLSRSKIDLFLNCPRCFYLDRRLGTGQPPGFPFNLNSAVDALLKKEFDYYRNLKKPHPMLIQHNIDAIPFSHEDLDSWRDSLRRGIQYHHQPTNFIISGGIDDVWINPKGELIIVDYKATSKNGEVSLDADWQIGYKRQMSLYAWLFKKNNFKVHEFGYFVYCNGRTDLDKFNQKLEFKVSLLPYQIDDSWIEGTIQSVHTCLNSEAIPALAEDCDHCQYFGTVASHIEKIKS